jgi:5-(carboxyamino)imidazole ribonucleotide mutase
VQSDVPLVGVVMGSDSDWPVMGAAAEVLDEFGVAYEADVVSAHRMPREMIAYGEQAASRGLKVIIAGAGGAAHLPGMLASVTPLPVIGVPVPLKYLDGMDSLLSIVQMPAGIPVATVAVGGARNAGLLAVRILAAADDELRTQMIEFQARLTAQAKAKGAALREKLLSPAGRPDGSCRSSLNQSSLRLVADCDDLVTYSRKCYRSSTGPRQTVDLSYRFGHGGVLGVFTSAPVGHSGVSAGSRNGTGCECLAGGLGALR